MTLGVNPSIQGVKLSSDTSIVLDVPLSHIILLTSIDLFMDTNLKGLHVGILVVQVVPVGSCVFLLLRV